MLFNQNESKAVILNIIEQSGEQRKLRGQRKFDSNRIPPIDELGVNSAVKIDITISTGVANKPDGFEVEGRKDKSYYQSIDINEVSSSQDKYEGEFKKIENVDVSRLILKITGDETRLEEWQSNKKLKEFLSPLTDALFPFKELVNKESSFQAIMQGLFMNGDTIDDKEIGVYTESNAYPIGRMDLGLSFTQLSESDGSLIEDDPIIVELKHATSGSDASRQLKQAERQMDGKYEILRSFTDKRTAKHLAIVFNTAAKNKQNMILASIRDVDVYHTTSGSSPERPYRKRPGSPLAGCSKRRKTRGAGVSCIDSREESIEEKEGKEELIKKLFDNDEIRKRIKNVEFYDQLHEQISKGEILNKDIKKAFLAKAQGANPDLMEPEIRDTILRIQEEIDRGIKNKELKDFLEENGVAERIGKVTEGAGLYRNAFPTKNSKIQEYINNNPKVMNHLNRVGKISGEIMQGMMYRNLIDDILSGNGKGVAINLGFIAGSPLLSKMAEAASVGGLKLVSEGKVFLGRALGMASPFLARITTAFIGYDLVNQIKELKAGNKDALVRVIGDGIYLSVDVAEIGIELAEVAKVLEGVSSVTGPIGAAIGAIVSVGTDIYLAVRTVKQKDKIIHLTGWEKFKEGWRAFLHISPEQYIEELIGKKEVNNQLVKSGIELLKRNTNIQRYVFPTGRSVVDSCRTIEERRERCSKGSPINGICPMGTGIYKSYKREECDTKIQLNLESSVVFSEKGDIFPSRVSPDNPEEGELFCLPRNISPTCHSISMFNVYWGDCQSSNGYYCDSAIGVSYTKDRTGNYTLIALGKGEDRAVGFKGSPNIFLVEDGNKRFIGGDKDDTFVLSGSEIEGILYGGGGNNILDLRKFAPGYHVKVEESTDGMLFLTQSNHPKSLRLMRVQEIFGRENERDVVRCTTKDIKYIDGKGGSNNYPDRIIIAPGSASRKLGIAVRPDTEIRNDAHEGNFDYITFHGKGSADIYIDFLLISKSKHRFLFNYTLSDLKEVTTYTAKNITFSFQTGHSGIFNINISTSESHPSYLLLGDGTEIRIGNKGSLYALQNTGKHVDKIIEDYPTIANRLNMTIAVQSCNEAIIIGHGKHEILYNDPELNSHLVGNGGENIYVIAPTKKMITIYDVDEESSIDTLDLRNVMKGAQDISLKVFQHGNNLLITLIELESGEYLLALKIRDGTRWYEKLHIIAGSVPMQLEHINNSWEVNPLPLTFDDNIEIIVITAKDVSERNKLIVHKQAGQYVFSRLRDDLMITTDSSLGESNVCTILLSNFYQEPKMRTLFLEFNDKTISLQKEEKEIDGAVVFCRWILQINKEFRAASNTLSYYDCLKFNSEVKVLFLKLGLNLLLLSDQGKLLIQDYYSDVYRKWCLVELNDSVIKPEEFIDKATKAVRVNSFRYYQSGEKGLEIYHNQPDNKYQIGLMDLKNKSILDCSVEIIDGDLMLSLKNRPIVQVKNWNIPHQPVREKMFAFNDTVVFNAKCIVSNCNPEDIVNEFEKEIAKLINKKDEDGNTLLHHTAMKGDLDKAKLLVRNGANVNEKNNLNMTSLDVAFKNKQKEVVKFFLSVRGNENSKQRHRRHHIRHEDRHSRHRNHYSPIQEVTSSSAKPSSWINDLCSWVKDYVGGLFSSRAALPENLPKQREHTKLHYAAGEGELNLVKLRVNQGYNINAKNEDEMTPLDIAKLYSKSEVVSFLQEKKKEYNSLLLTAARNGNLNQVQNLLDRGANINAKNGKGETPLGLANRLGRSEIANFLREKQNERSVQHKRRHHQGDHPLHHSSRKLLAKDFNNQSGIAAKQDASKDLLQNGEIDYTKGKATSGTSKPSSWINVFANTIIGAIKGVSHFLSLRAALPLSSGNSSDHTDTAGNSFNRSGTVRNPNIQYTNQFSREVCAGSIASFTLFSLQAVLDKKCPLPKFSDVNPVKALFYTSDIIKSFKEVLEKQAESKGGIKMHRLDINFEKLFEEINEKIRNGEFNEISGILKSYAEEALPGREPGDPGRLSPKKFDKFMAEFNRRIDPVISQLMQQMLSRLEVSNVKEQRTSLEPESYQIIFLFNVI